MGEWQLLPGLSVFPLLLSSQPAASAPPVTTTGRHLAAPLIPEHIWQNCPSLRVASLSHDLATLCPCSDLPLTPAPLEPVTPSSWTRRTGDRAYWGKRLSLGSASPRSWDPRKLMVVTPQVHSSSPLHLSLLFCLPLWAKSHRTRLFLAPLFVGPWALTSQAPFPTCEIEVRFIWMGENLRRQ